MLNFSIAAIRGFILIYICTFMIGCGLIDWWLGPTPEKVYENIDVNKDGNISPEEIARSKYDLNKDGVFSPEEMVAATEGSDIPSIAFGILAALNVPFAGAAGLAMRKLKENKGHLRSMAGGIEDLVNLKEDGITKDDIYAAIDLSAKHRGDAKALHLVVKEIKTAIRSDGSHIAPNTITVDEALEDE